MKTRQRGVAIIIAMTVVAMAALAAVAIVASQSTWARHSELAADHVQAQILVRAGVDWTRAVLSDDRHLSNVDHLSEPWALRLPPIPVENGNVEGYIEDQQGLFNLNNLVTDGKVNLIQLANFRRLLSLLSLSPEIADALVDWMDADSELFSLDGAEDEYYAAMPSPDLAANQALADVDELERVRGFDAAVLARLRPFVTALPPSTPGTSVNANTASAEILAAVVDGMDLDSARALVAQRNRLYFRDAADIVSRLPRGASVGRDVLGVSSDYFKATLRATLGVTEASGTVLLARKTAGWPVIVWGKYL